MTVEVLRRRHLFFLVGAHMNTIERTRRILDTLNDAAEHLKEYADDIWLSVDRSTPEAIRSGAERQVEFLQAQDEFSSLASKLEELIRGDMTSDAREKIDDVGGEQRERLIETLDRSVPHRLTEAFTWKRPFAIRLGEHRVGQQNTWKGTYRWLLQQLAEEDPVRFDALVDADFALTTRGKHHISQRKADVRSAIEVSGLFFESNLSANDSRDKMIEVLNAMGRATDDVAIYLREDRDSDG